MTDTAVVTPAAPVAPVAAPAPVAPAPAPPAAQTPAAPAAATPLPGSQAPPSVAGIKQSAKESVRTLASEFSKANAEPAPSPAATQPRDDAGRFAPAADAAGSTPAPAGDAAPAPGPSSTPAATIAVPEGWSTLPVPEGNPLRARGVKEIPVPPGMEDYYRHVLDNPVRKVEVDSAQRRATALEQEVIRLRAELAVGQAPAAKVLDNKVLTELYEDVKSNYSPELAELIREGAEARQAKLTHEATETATADTALDKAAEHFGTTVTELAPKKYGVWAESGELPTKLAQAVAKYAEFVDAGKAPPEPEAFFRWLDGIYTRDPRVQQKLSAWQQGEAAKERDRIRAEVRAELLADEQARFDENRRLRQENPMGQIPLAPSLPRDTVAPDAELRGLSKDQLKSRLKAGLKHLLAPTV